MRQEDIESWRKTVKAKDMYGSYYSRDNRRELERDHKAGPPEDLPIWRWSALDPPKSLRKQESLFFLSGTVQNFGTILILVVKANFSITYLLHAERRYLVYEIKFRNNFKCMEINVIHK